MPFSFLYFHNPGPNYLDLIIRPVFSIRLDEAHALDHPHSTLHSAKYRMLSVQPRCGCKSDKELTAVGVGSTVRHAQNPGSSMLQALLNLVFKFLAVDRASSSAGAGWIAGLDHEVGDNAVENHVVVVASLRERRKVLTCLLKNPILVQYRFEG